MLDTWSFKFIYFIIDIGTIVFFIFFFSVDYSAQFLNNVKYFYPIKWKEGLSIFWNFLQFGFGIAHVMNF